MRKIILAVLTTTMLLVPGTAVADPSAAGDCGLGSGNAHDAITDTANGPGASETAKQNPVGFGCTGKP